MTDPHSREAAAAEAEFSPALRRRVDLKHLRAAASNLEEAQANLGCCLGLQSMWRELLLKQLAAIESALTDAQDQLER